LVCWPSVAELRVEAGLSSTSIAHARLELIAAGLVAKAEGHQQAGADPVAVYRISVRPKVSEQARAAAKARRCRQQTWTERQRACRRRAIDGADAAAHPAGRKRLLHAADLDGDGATLPLVQPRT
jgi:hypothetical protein